MDLARLRLFGPLLPALHPYTFLPRLAPCSRVCECARACRRLREGTGGTTRLICGLLLSPGIGCASYAPGSPLLPYSSQTEGKGKASLTPESSPGDYARFTRAAWPGVGGRKGPPPQPSSSPALLPPQSSPPIPAPALPPTSLEQARPPLQAAVPALVSELELALEQAEVGSVLQGLGQAGLPPAELLLPPGQL